MTTNPYAPPQSPAAEAAQENVRVKGHYFGGYWMVTGVGVLGGLMVAGGMIAEMMMPVVPLPFVMPAIAWIGALATLFLLLRGIHIEPATKVIAPLLLAVPAYVLYVPVCTFSAMFTSTFPGSGDYMPAFPGMVLVSVVCFVVILLLFAAGVRARFKGTIHGSESESVPSEDMSA